MGRRQDIGQRRVTGRARGSWRAAAWHLAGLGLWLGLAGGAQAQANWVPDPLFSPEFGNNVFAIAHWVDGERVMVGGAFTTVSSEPHLRLVRLIPGAQGAIDTTCSTSDGPNASVRALAVNRAVSTIWIGGDFTSVGAVTRNRIARLREDCSLDATFDPGAGANATVSAVRMQDLHRVLIGGAFTEVSGQVRNRIARLGSNGSLDATFNPDVDGTVNSIELQDDGKILIGGSFNHVGGVVRRNIARLNSDGTLDATFAPAMASEVHTIVELSGGQVLRGGYPFSGAGAVARLAADSGATDASFAAGVAGPNGVVRSMALDADGKILIGGDFTEVSGVARNRIARLNADGSLDTTFDPGSGADRSVFVVHASYDGTVLLGGQFSAVNGQANTARMARLTPAQPTIGGSVFGLTAAGLVLRNNGGDDLAVPAAGNPASFVFATPGTPGGNYDVTILAQPAGQLCRVDFGRGVVNANVSSVEIYCDAAALPIPVNAPWALALLSVALGAVGWRRARRGNS